MKIKVIVPIRIPLINIAIQNTCEVVSLRMVASFPLPSSLFSSSPSSLISLLFFALFPPFSLHFFTLFPHMALLFLFFSYPFPLFLFFSLFFILFPSSLPSFYSFFPSSSSFSFSPFLLVISISLSSSSHFSSLPHFPWLPASTRLYTLRKRLLAMNLCIKFRSIM